jgi:tRNA nucleotidyltransferase (CCA-adding enzyme)
MKVYLVGGAVRDELLELPSGERDWVVVGATPAELEAQGYRAVGKDFPVFLHPDSGEEYALARLERKTGPGYRGFVTEHSPAVTLEEDLQRRDLTVNAIARAPDGTLIDPYGGRDDLAAHVLRHVSPAFTEDPVRVLRVARFAARFADLHFHVAPETLALMQQMVRAGELAALVPERVWRELSRALASSRPEVFFQTLRDCGALAVVLPEIATLLDDPAASGAQALAALQAAAIQESSLPVRWAALVAGLPAPMQQSLHARLKVPAEFSELAALTARLQLALEAAGGAAGVAASPEAQVTLLEAADAWRRPERFAQWLAVLAARAPVAGVPHVDVLMLTGTLLRAHELTAAVRLADEILSGLHGRAIGDALRQRRIQVLE